MTDFLVYLLAFGVFAVWAGLVLIELRRIRRAVVVDRKLEDGEAKARTIRALLETGSGMTEAQADELLENWRRQEERRVAMRARRSP